jgi:inner membrane transporter RhtA
MAKVDRAPPQVYFLVSAVFHYLGPAFAVLLFTRVGVLGVAWLRIASAAVVFAAWRKPWRAFAIQDGDGRSLLLAWGAVLAVMNACFYLAIDRLPLGTVAAIEFVPVVALAAVGARSLRNLLALTLAVTGVYLLTDVQLSAQPLGLAFAVANASLFALYIVLADRVAKRPQLSGIDGLGASMLVAALVVTLIGGRQALTAFAHPTALLAGVGVGVCSSVIPYITDQLALRRLSRATYALMVSLLPATATVIGIVVLAQIPTPAELLGVLLVVSGVALHRERAKGARIDQPAQEVKLARVRGLPRDGVEDQRALVSRAAELEHAGEVERNPLCLVRARQHLVKRAADRGQAPVVLDEVGDRRLVAQVVVDVVALGERRDHQ